MRFIIAILIVVLIVGGAVVTLGFLSSQKYIDVPEISNQYEKLDDYRDELEKLDQNNRQALKDLEEQISDSDDTPLDQINKEIKSMEEAIKENAAELERVITEMSETKIDP